MKKTFQVPASFGLSMLVTLAVCSGTGKEEPDNPESLIDTPRWFVMGKDGMFFLPHSHDNRIQVFSPEGDYLRSFGRAGDGPTGVLISIRQPHKFKGNVLQMCGGVLTSTAEGDSINWNSTEWVNWGCQTSGPP